MKLIRLIKTVVFTLLLFTGAYSIATELHSYAIVQDDGSLLIKNRRVHLYGIYLADNTHQCQASILPAHCGRGSVLALNFKIQGFVHCYPQTENEDGSLNGFCYVGRSKFKEGEDLGAYLIEQGWALALPHAPFAYHAMERIARHNNRGVWGFTVKRFR